MLARFFFDGSLIGLEALDLLGIAIIVALYFDDLLSQSFVFGALLLVDDHSIGPEHNMHKQEHSENGDGDGCQAAAQGVNLHQSRTHALDP